MINIILYICKGIFYVTTGTCRNCRKNKNNTGLYRKVEEKPYNFLTSCMIGDLKTVQKNLLPKEQINDGAIIATEANHPDLLKFLISEGVTNIDDCLTIASQHNRFSLVKLLVENGGNIRIPMKFSKSPNIISFVYDFEYKRKQSV